MGGWKQAILPASGWGKGQGLQDSPGARCRVAACACDHDGDDIGYGCISVIGAVKILTLPKWLDQIGHQVIDQIGRQQKDAPGTS